MATVTAKPIRNLAEAQQRVRHPLERVRGTIRLYVGLEGAALLLTLLSLWFWIDLALDYGFFRTFSLDWVQALDQPVRAVLLGILFVGVLLFVQILFFNLFGNEVKGLIGKVQGPFGVRRRLPLWTELILVAATFLITGAMAWDAGIGELLGLGPILSGAIVLGMAIPASGAVFWAARSSFIFWAISLVAVLVYLGGWRLAGGLADPVGPFLSALLVLGLLAGPVVFVALRRLLYDFRDDAIALVLERRFPKELGDRLITAVELADTTKTSAYGYSRTMIEQTIHDAAECVAQVKVAEVFDWKRLYRQWYLVAGITLGLYLVIGGAGCAYDQVWQTEAPALAGFSRLQEVVSLWFERNVMLRNAIWPRRAYLEILDWPKEGELCLGKDAPPHPLRVRAYKWVIADPSTREGWRPLTWKDLVERPHLLGEGVPTDSVPADWGMPRDPSAGWSIDEIELRLGRPEVHATLPSEAQVLFRNVLEKLEQRAGEPALRRTLRMLVVPATATVSYRGANSGGEMMLQRQGDNEYTGQFNDLKETIRFYVRGEDYYTRTYQIMVVPTPMLVDMVVDEYRPAYMFYRVLGGKAEALKGKKKLVSGRKISLYGGDTSRIDPVPAGTDLVLTATSDKDLISVRIPGPRKGVAKVEEEVKLLNQNTFQVRFDAVKATPERPVYDFYFEFVDTDKVKGMRHMVIKPVDDAGPDVDVSAEVVRKTSQGYLVTPLARVPLRVKVTDDYGLDTLEYACTVSKIDKGADQGLRGLLLLRAFPLAAGGPGQELAAAARIAALIRESQTAEKPETEANVKRFPVIPFEQHLRAQRREFFTLDQIDKLLGNSDGKPDQPLTRFFELVASEKDPIKEPEAFFDVERLGLKADETREIQPRYRVQLWVEAVDNDIETGPHRGPGKERLNILVVSENEVLSEIAKEEENLYMKLADRVKSLQDGMAKLDRLKEDLTTTGLKVEQISGMTVRTDELSLLLEKSELAVGEVLSDYKRILQELITNRVQTAMIDRVQSQICNPLEECLNRDFPAAKTGFVDLRKVLESKEADLATKVGNCRTAADEARNRLEALNRNLVGVLDKMQQLADINMLIKMIREIEEEEERQGTVLKKIRQQKQEELLKALQGGGSKP